MRVAIIISSGIGNALLMVPLLKQIREKSRNHISVLLTSPFLDKAFLEHIGFPVDQIIELTRGSLLLYSLARLRAFDLLYLDMSSASVKHILLGKILARKLIAMRDDRYDYLPFRNIPPIPSLHAAILNKHLHKDQKTNFELHEMFVFPRETKYSDFPEAGELKKRGKMLLYCQVSSANMKAPYKNWPVKNWIELLQKITAHFPDILPVLTGDTNEKKIGLDIADQLHGKVVNRVGNTDLKEAAILLQHSFCYLGLDSAFMHLAVAFDKPSFSIFGASSYRYIGYEQFNPEKHKTIHNPLPCWPCFALTKVNTNRVDDPSECPDFKCITGISPKLVFKAFKKFVEMLEKNKST